MKTKEVRRSVKEACDAGKFEEEEMCGWSSLAKCLPRLHEALGLVPASQTFPGRNNTHQKLEEKQVPPPPILPQPHTCVQSV